MNRVSPSHMGELAPTITLILLLNSMVASAKLAAHSVPLEIVHLTVYIPCVETLKPELKAVGSENVPVPGPEINVHNPVPTVGELPANVVEVTPHSDWLLAVAVDGGDTTDTVTDAQLAVPQRLLAH